MPKTTRSYRSWQLEKLANPEIALNYLNAALEESPEIFLTALGKVAQANQMTRVAEDAGIQRETLYRSFSEQGNPTFATLSNVLSALGMRLAIAAKDSERVPREIADELGVAAGAAR
jgi:probable addiction module antidote protein